MSIFDELESKSTVEKKVKQTKTKTKNPILKESRNLLIYSASTVVLSFGFVSGFLTEDAPFNVFNTYDKYKTIENSIDTTDRNIVMINEQRSKIDFVQAQVKERIEQLQNANIVRTDLEESHYFTAYFDTLLVKHNIHLHSIEVLEHPEIESPDNVEVEVVETVNPLHIIMEGSSEDVVNLFKDLYTKSITYDNNLKFINLYDKHVRVEFDITFKKGGDQ